jgi:predicted permease
VIDTIKQGSLTQTGFRTRHRFLQQLISTQVGIALILVNTVLLLLVGYRAALAANKSLSTEYILSAQITVKGGSYSRESRTAFWTRLIERVQSLPGVTTAGVTTKLPLNGGNNRSVLVDGETYDAKISRPDIEQSWISPTYFTAMSIPLLKGRTHEPANSQSAAPSIVVNRAMVDRYWPGQDPLGKRILDNNPSLTLLGIVVGVVENVRQRNIGHPALPEMYFPYSLTGRIESYLIVRSAFDTHQMVPTLRRELTALDPDLALANPMTMAELVSDQARQQQTILLLTSLFMATTVLMGAIGIYGTLAFQMRQRTREVGVRLALGAAAHDIVSLVLRQVVVSLVVGGLAGLGLSVGIAYTLRRMLADVSPFNPFYYAASISALAIVVALACWLPARRATKINPIEALRAD